MVIPQAMVPIGFAIMALLVVLRLLTGGDRTRAGGSGPLNGGSAGAGHSMSAVLVYFVLPAVLLILGCRSSLCCW